MGLIKDLDETNRAIQQSVKSIVDSAVKHNAIMNNFLEKLSVEKPKEDLLKLMVDMQSANHIVKQKALLLQSALSDFDLWLVRIGASAIEAWQPDKC